MKDHEIRELVTNLTVIAKDYAGTQQLRGRISGCVLNRLRATEAAAYQRFSDEKGWIGVASEDIEHYKTKGQQIRKLIAMPNV